MLKQRKLEPLEANFRLAVKIVLDNPTIFNDKDKAELIKCWFGSRGLEILDPTAKKLRCGVGWKQGVECKSTCTMADLCIHTKTEAISISEIKKKEGSEPKVTISATSELLDRVKIKI